MLDHDDDDGDNCEDAIFKVLTFGVKKTKLFNSSSVTFQNGKNDEKLRRIRILPEDHDDLQGGTGTGRPDEGEDDDDAEGPELLAGSGLSLRSYQDRRKAERKKAEQRKRSARIAKMNRLRKLNRIFTWGDNIPDPLVNFTDIVRIPTELLANLEEFRIQEPSPIQMQAIPIMQQRRDLLASAPTGSGKTLVFIIPTLMDVLRLKKLPKYQQGGRLIALVLEPTRELAKQTYIQYVKFAQHLPISCALFENEKVISNADIIISTPNRLSHLIEASPSSDITGHFKWLRWLIVDESDRLFETTEGDERCFRNQLAKIYRVCDGKYTHRAFFSATFSYEVEQWCKDNLHDVAMVCVGARNSATDSVEQELVFAGSEHGKVIAIRNLFRKGFQPPALIFVQSKDRARQLLSEISSFNPPIPAALISSEKSDKERDSAISKFRDGSLWVLVCTELMGRGLDLKGVNLVINFDLPTSVINYIHRIGRTGRAGRRGRAITYFTENDMDVIRPIATVINQAGFPVPEYTLRMRKLSRNDRKGLLKHPPKRKNIGAVKKRFIKKDTESDGSPSQMNPEKRAPKNVTHKTHKMGRSTGGMKRKPMKSPTKQTVAKKRAKNQA